jgi:signal transduction histidine kinase
MARRSRQWIPPLSALLLLSLLPSRASAGTRLLTRATQVRALTQEEAAEHWPVKLQGIVLGEAEPEGHALVIQDGDEPIYLKTPGEFVSDFRRGDVVQVEGVSDPGGFAPFVLASRVRKVGLGRVPEPETVTFEQLISGRLDAHWVEVSGIVRHCEAEGAGRSRMDLATGGGRLTVQIDKSLPPGAFIDAEIRLRGLCFNQHNSSRQMTNPLLLVQRGVPIVTIAPAPPLSPDDTPMPSVRLLQFAPRGIYGHRVHVRGVVIYHHRGQAFWMRDGARGLLVESRQTEALEPGDEVDVLGFPHGGVYTPMLQDAVYRKRTSGSPPGPVRLADAALAVRHDADLVELEARLLENRAAREGWVLVLDWRGSPVKALLGVQEGAARPEGWLPGSIVRVRGICSVDPGNGGPVSGLWVPDSFQILLRTAADVAVVRPPPWLNRERLMTALVVFAALLLLAVTVVILAARRRLREQRVQRATAEAELSAMLAERGRIAREIHDTLAQDLGAISMHLELAKSETVDSTDGRAVSVAQHLDTAHRLVRRSLVEARQSIWNMRSQVLEDQDLAGALDGLLHQLSDGTGAAARLTIIGAPRRLAAVAENELLRIGQEAITNATKHAQARHVDVTLQFSGDHVELRVRDDGCGFDATDPPQGRGTFGLVGMRERAARLQTAIAVRSAPGSGTEVRVRLPLPSDGGT